MGGFFAFSLWDPVLLAVVAFLALGVAYLPSPRHKAFLLSLPLPSTVGTLSVGAVDGSNILGLSLLLLFSWQTYWCYNKLRWNIFAAIAGAAAFYCALGMVLFAVVPRHGWGFGFAVVWNFALAVPLLFWVRGRRERGHKSLMSVPRKIAVILLVIGGLLVLKKFLGGFVATFPMVGVIAAYEGRFALWSIARQIPLVMFTLGVFYLAAYLTQPVLGLYGALAVGWATFLLLFFPINRKLWSSLNNS